VVERERFDFCVGTADADLRRRLVAALAAAGFHSAGAAADGPELLRLLRGVQPWLAVIDTALPPPGKLQQLAAIIEEDCLAAAVYLGPGGPGLEQCVRLPRPVDGAILAAVAEAVCLDFARAKRLHREIGLLRRKLAERREIEKAKRLLMQRHSVSEEEAYRFLRGLSMRGRLSLSETARRVILDPGAFPFP
jgi:hypothetical protein